MDAERVHCFAVSMHWSQFREGEIRLQGDLVEYGSKNLVSLRQKIGMVFQSYELFPHLTVMDNIILAPTKVQKRKKRRSKRRGNAAS